MERGVDPAGRHVQRKCRKRGHPPGPLAQTLRQPGTEGFERLRRPHDHKQQRAGQEPAEEGFILREFKPVFPESENRGHGRRGAYPGGAGQAGHQHGFVRQEQQAVKKALRRFLRGHQVRQRERQQQHDIGRDEVGIAESGNGAVAVRVQEARPDQLHTEILQHAVYRSEAPHRHDQVEKILLVETADKIPGEGYPGDPERAAVRVPETGQQAVSLGRGLKVREQEPQAPPEQDKGQPPGY